MGRRPGHRGLGADALGVGDFDNGMHQVGPAIAGVRKSLFQICSSALIRLMHLWMPQAVVIAG